MGYDGSLLIKPTFYCYSCKNELTLIFGKILQQLNNSYCYVNDASSHDNISRFFPLFNCLVFLPFSWAHNAFSMEFCHKNVCTVFQSLKCPEMNIANMVTLLVPKDFCPILPPSPFDTGQKLALSMN